MREDVCEAVIGISLMIIAIGIIAGGGGVIGYDMGESAVRQEAIDHGCGEWRCDPATGEIGFVWRGELDG